MKNSRMKFGICLLSVIPVRDEPSNKAEMLTQLVFGDLMIVQDSKHNWLNIRIVYDNYEGWVDEKQIFYIEEEEFNRLNSAPCHFSKDLVEIVQDERGNIIPVLFGSSLRLLENDQFSIANKLFSFTGQLSDPSSKIQVSSIIEDAMLFLSAPYLWGGKTPFGIDCSGFIQTVFKVNGVELMRDSSQQATQGETINLMDEALPGDLVFFDNEEAVITHIGMILEKEKVIHASGKVRIDSIDYHGIYNKELNKYTHKLRLIKRIL